MPRVKRGVTAKAKHKKILNMTKGHYGARSRTYRVAKQSAIKALQYAYVGRKLRKRDYRALWITRINAACKDAGLSYSRFIHGLKLANIDIDRKMMAELAVMDKSVFAELVGKATIALSK